MSHAAILELQLGYPTVPRQFLNFITFLCPVIRPGAARRVALAQMAPGRQLKRRCVRVAAAALGGERRTCVRRSCTWGAVVFDLGIALSSGPDAAVHVACGMIEFGKATTKRPLLPSGAPALRPCGGP